MKVYHGTNVDINTIELNNNGTRDDFGNGFYLDTNQKHAKVWANIVCECWRTAIIMML